MTKSDTQHGWGNCIRSAMREDLFKCNRIWPSIGYCVQSCLAAARYAVSRGIERGRHSIKPRGGRVASWTVHILDHQVVAAIASNALPARTRSSRAAILGSKSPPGCPAIIRRTSKAHFVVSIGGCPVDPSTLTSPREIKQLGHS